MHTWSNMAWPDDPYGTGQQLYRRPSPQLAAFTLLTVSHDSDSTSSAFAVVYLPLYRRGKVAVTEGTLTFGFCVFSVTDTTEMPDLAAAASLSLMHSWHHAAIFTGLAMDDDIAILRSSAVGQALRGLKAVQQAWVDRSRPTPGTADVFDCATDLLGVPDLQEACRRV